MSKRLIIILALVFVAAFTMAAYAEVQNVKVSGDLTIKGVSRENIDLNKTRREETTASTDITETNNDEQDNFLSIARVKIDADLTDNVSTTIRLINERDWDGDNAAAANNDIDIDLAYVSMKEFLYSPLSLTLGRQELIYGNGLVVGDPDTNNLSGATSLTQDDLSLRKAFDSVKAVLNYDPLVVDLVYSKIDENTITGNGANDDTDLYGLNANYALNKETTLEGYVFSKNTGSSAAEFTAAQRTRAAALTVNPNDHDLVNTFGVRISNSSIKNLKAQLEFAWQSGTYHPGFDINSLDNSEVGNRSAKAIQATLNYDLKDLPYLSKYISKYNPYLTGTYTYLSGAGNRRTTGSYHGWDPMFEDQTFGHLANRIFRATNMQILYLSGKATPVEDLTLTLDYANYWLNERFPIESTNVTTIGYGTTNFRNVAGAATYRMGDNKNLGQELDATLSYDYTEDVQFSLLGGVFLPGSAFHTINDSSAGEIIGSMKVTF